MVHYGLELQKQYAESRGGTSPAADAPQTGDLAGIAALHLQKGLDLLQAPEQTSKAALGELSKYLVDLAQQDDESGAVRWRLHGF